MKAHGGIQGKEIAKHVPMDYPDPKHPSHKRRAGSIHAPTPTDLKIQKPQVQRLLPKHEHSTTNTSLSFHWYKSTPNIMGTTIQMDFEPVEHTFLRTALRFC